MRYVLEDRGPDTPRVIELKKCCSCLEELSIASFYKAKNKDGLSGYCKDCANHYVLERTYGTIPPVTRRPRIYKDGDFPLHGYVPPKPDNGLCELCLREPDVRGLCKDHEHSIPTNNFRAWLCNNCNSGFGLMGDTLEDIERAATFWRRRYTEPRPWDPDCQLTQQENHHE